MNAVKFEQLLSFKPNDKFMVEQPCLRDLIFYHFEESFDGNLEIANSSTKLYTDELYKRFINAQSVEAAPLPTKLGDISDADWLNINMTAMFVR
jgi:hypothetical protein